MTINCSATRNTSCSMISVLTPCECDFKSWSVTSCEPETLGLRGVLLAQSSDTAEVVESLEDSQMTLASLAASRYAAPFREEVTAWLSKLASVSEQVVPFSCCQALSYTSEANFAFGCCCGQFVDSYKSTAAGFYSFWTLAV